MLYPSRLNNAIRSGYHTLLPKNSYPVAVININLDPEFVDANVHPTKREVRFSNERRVLDLLQMAVYDTLRSIDLAPRMKDAESSSPSPDCTSCISPNIPVVSGEVIHNTVHEPEPVYTPVRSPLQVREASLSEYRTSSRQLRQSQLIPDG